MLNTMSLETIPSMSKPAKKEKVFCRPSHPHCVVGLVELKTRRASPKPHANCKRNVRLYVNNASAHARHSAQATTAIILEF